MIVRNLLLEIHSIILPKDFLLVRHGKVTEDARHLVRLASSTEAIVVLGAVALTANIGEVHVACNLSVLIHRVISFLVVRFFF